MEFSNLADKERKRLVMLLEEARQRGLRLDKKKLQKEYRWPRDPDGFFIKSDGKHFIPNDENQSGFYYSKARFIALFAGRGSGKSAVGAQKALEKISQGKSGAVLNPDFENFRISTWPEFKEWIPWSMVVPTHRYKQGKAYNPNQPFNIAFLNGATVICKGLKDEDSARGPNINWLWYDESGRDKTGKPWQIAVPSVRIGDNPQAWTTTTPKGKAHWTYKFFVEQDGIDKKLIKEYETLVNGNPLIEYFITSLEANKNNVDPGYYASMMAAYPPGYLRDQEIFGLFVDEGGRLGDRKWFDGKFLDERPEFVQGKVRFWDLAATEKKLFGNRKNDPDETVGSLVSRLLTNDFVIENQVAGQWEWKDIKNNIKRTAEIDGFGVKIRIEQEPASGGKNQIAELVEFIHKEVGTAWDIEGYRPEGDRVQAANVWFAEAAQGKWYMVRGSWNEPCLMQLDAFPDPDVHDDKITSISGARLTLAPIRTWKEIDFLHL